MLDIPINYKILFIQEWQDINLDTEDGGMALIYHVEESNIPELFVKIQSWDETKKHAFFNEAIAGRKIKITIETFE